MGEQQQHAQFKRHQQQPQASKNQRKNTHKSELSSTPSPSLSSSSNALGIRNYFQKTNYNNNNNPTSNLVKQEATTTVEDEEPHEAVVDTSLVDLTQSCEKTSTQAVFSSAGGKPCLLPFVSPIRGGGGGARGGGGVNGVKSEAVEINSRSAAVKRKKEILDVKSSFTPPARTTAAALKSYQFNKTNKFKIEPTTKDVAAVVNDTIMIEDDEDDFEADFKKPKNTTSTIVSLTTRNGFNLKCVNCHEQVCQLELAEYATLGDNYVGHLPASVASRVLGTSSSSSSRHRQRPCRLIVIADESSKSTAERALNVKKIVINDDGDNEDDCSLISAVVNCFLDDLGRSWQYLECRNCCRIVGVVLRSTTASSPDVKFFQMFVNKLILLIDDFVN